MTEPIRLLIVRWVRENDVTCTLGALESLSQLLETRAEQAEATLARVTALTEHWRNDAERHAQHGDCYRKGKGWGLKDCADELDAALVDPPVSSSTETKT